MFKKALILPSLVFSLASAQSPQSIWIKDLQQTNTQASIFATGNSGDVYALVGRKNPTDNRYVERYNAAGTLVWSHNWDFARVEVYPNNDIALSGSLSKTTTFGTTTINYDATKYAFVGFFDDNANLKSHLYLKHGNWVHALKINDAGETFIMGVIKDTINFNGQLLINTATTDKTFLVKLDPAFNLVSYQLMHLSSLPRTLSIDKNNNIFISGFFQQDLYMNNSLLFTKSHLNTDTYVIKLNFISFQSSWARQIKGGYLASETGTDDNGDFYITGMFSDTVKSGSHMAHFECLPNQCQENFVAKFSSNGTPAWLTQIGKIHGENLFTYKVSRQGNTYFTGDLGKTLYVGNDSIVPGPIWITHETFIGRINSSGKLNWSYIPQNSNAFGDALSTANNGSSIIWGGMADRIVIGSDSVKRSQTQSLPSLFMVRFNDTLTQTTALDKFSDSKDLNIYPNPTNGKFSVTTKVTAEIFSIHVFNITGSCIYSAESDKKEIDLTGQAPGIYLVQAKSGNDTFRQKIIIQ